MVCGKVFISPGGKTPSLPEQVALLEVVAEIQQIINAKDFKEFMNGGKVF